MKLQFYQEKLTNSEQYRKFLKENKDAYFCSGLFVLDKEKKENEVNFDFYIPSSKRLFSFKLNDEIKLNELKTSNQVPNKTIIDFDIDLGKIEKIILKKMELEKIKNKPKKFLFSLQSLENKNFLLATIFVSSLGLIKVTISLPKQEIIDFEKKSFSDLFKILKK